jgi:hypothetical protein
LSNECARHRQILSENWGLIVERRKGIRSRRQALEKKQCHHSATTVLLGSKHGGEATELPLAYEEKIEQIPGVKAVTSLRWFGGVYKDVRDPTDQSFLEPIAKLHIRICS